MNNIGTIEIARGNWDYGLRYLKEAIKLEPINPATLSNLLIIYAKLGSHKQFKKYQYRLKKYNPQWPHAIASFEDCATADLSDTSMLKGF